MGVSKYTYAAESTRSRDKRLIFYGVLCKLGQGSLAQSYLDVTPQTLAKYKKNLSFHSNQIQFHTSKIKAIQKKYSLSLEESISKYHHMYYFGELNLVHNLFSLASALIGSIIVLSIIVTAFFSDITPGVVSSFTWSLLIAYGSTGIYFLKKRLILPDLKNNFFGSSKFRYIFFSIVYGTYGVGPILIAITMFFFGIQSNLDIITDTLGVLYSNSIIILILCIIISFVLRKRDIHKNIVRITLLVIFLITLSMGFTGIGLPQNSEDINHFENTAVATQDYSLCQKINSEKGRLSCEVRVATTSDDLEKCQSFSEKLDGNFLPKRSCLTKLAVQRNDTSLCILMDEEEIDARDSVLEIVFNKTTVTTWEQCLYKVLYANSVKKS